MTPSSVTCPHCKTKFRITIGQLKAANGSVRCGSCLQIFNASNQIPSPKKKEEVAETPGTVEKSTIPHQEKPSAPAQTRQPTQETLVVQQHKPVSKPESPQPKKSKSKSKTKTKTKNKSKSKTKSKSKNLAPSVKAKIAPAPMEYDGYHQQSIKTLIHELDQRETEEAISALQRRSKRAYWGVAACLLTLLLVLQFAWFNRNTLSLNPTLRPAYAITCSLLPCTLPPLVDINAIKSVDLVVRSHPNQANVLQVDAVIINAARHPQPFPDLELTFTDISGRLVANRTFTSAEYLGGELAGSEEMPTAQPIRLGLEIIDPGERAVNYRLTFSENRATRVNSER